MGSGDTELPKLSQPLINGTSQPVTGGETSELTDPSTAGIIGFVEDGGTDTVDSAVQNGHTAAKEWSALAGAERGRILDDVTDALRKQNVVYINEWFAPGVGSPFGGYKQSGIGREAGMEAIHGYTQTKDVTGAIGR